MMTEQERVAHMEKLSRRNVPMPTEADAIGEDSGIGSDRHGTVGTGQVGNGRTGDDIDKVEVDRHGVGGTGQVGNGRTGDGITSGNARGFSASLCEEELNELPHLRDALPEWKRLYEAVRKAMKT